MKITEKKVYNFTMTAEGIPFSINIEATDPETASAQLVRALKEILAQLESNNATIN